MLALVLLAGMVTASSVTSSSVAARRGLVVGAFSDGGVRVQLHWITGSADAGTLLATFTPIQSGFHLYSTDLPSGGVDGVGRPTLIEVGGGLQAGGHEVGDQKAAPQRIVGVAAFVPVYPNGPVTVRLPVVPARSGAGLGGLGGLSPGSLSPVWLSYAACSVEVCLAPVTRHPVAVTLPFRPAR
jgi:hypothetical protein